MTNGRIFTGLVGLLLSSPCTFGGQTPGAWPTRPVRLLVPFVAGGGVDTVARITSNRLGVGLGQQVIV
ncbi:MAG: tripartite tricarboxylate transporter substrate binding protein, partial [Burkholderiales bacterium]